MNPTDPALVPALERIAREAGALILRIYDRPAAELAVRHKADASPVTEADEAADAHITEALSSLTPGVPIVSEEGAPRQAAPLFWLVDPLDGTKEFLSRNGEFTVNIALIEEGRPILGVVWAPALGELYAAAGPGRAHRQLRDGAPQPIRARTTPADGPVIVVSRSHRGPETEAYLQRFPVYRAAERGSSLKFCLLAAGEADLYPRHGRTMEWDTAAGQAVLEAAGGAVRDLHGAPLRYGKAGFENPHFIAAGRAS